nr:MAG TPA: Cytochrome c oxidase polypeptide [Caudoviricetes sp.]
MVKMSKRGIIWLCLILLCFAFWSCIINLFML